MQSSTASSMWDSPPPKLDLEGLHGVAHTDTPLTTNPKVSMRKEATCKCGVPDDDSVNQSSPARLYIK